MEPARSKKRLEKPHSWIQLKHGEWVQESIQHRLNEWCPKLFGYHMLKLGGLSCEIASCACNIQHQVNLDLENPLHSVIADPYHLPFLKKSIDVVVMAHQLDYSNDPHRLLREVDRVLVDDGYLIISGFNPVSMMGVSSLLPWRKNNLPWSGRMFTPSRVSDWLGVLNYQVIECDRYALLPSHRLCSTWLENNTSSWIGAISSLYFIVARKRTYPLKPIKSSMKLKRVLSPISANCRCSPYAPK